MQADPGRYKNSNRLDLRVPETDLPGDGLMDQVANPMFI